MGLVNELLPCIRAITLYTSSRYELHYWAVQGEFKCTVCVCLVFAVLGSVHSSLELWFGYGARKRAVESRAPDTSLGIGQCRVNVSVQCVFAVLGPVHRSLERWSWIWGSYTGC